MNGEKAIIYARVSTENQTDNTSLDTQIEECTKSAQAQGFELVEVFREIFSGEFIFARPQFQKALETIERESIRHFIVDVRDRLGRGDVLPMVEFILELKGAKVHYARTQGSCSMDQFSVLEAPGVEEMVSKIEVVKTKDRTSRGREKVVRAGKVMASHSPYGYRVKEGHLEIIEEEARVVRQIYQWFAIDKISKSEIKRRLFSLGIPTPGEAAGITPQFGSCVWYLSSILNILRNETYAGVWRYLKQRELRHEVGSKLVRKCITRPKSEQIEVAVPAIISHEIWEEAQRMVEFRRQEYQASRIKYEYLLCGIVYCSCGRKMVLNKRPRLGRKTTNLTQYFLCPTSFRGVTKHVCNNQKFLRLDGAEREVWTYIRELVSQPHLIIQNQETRRRADLVQRDLINLQVRTIGNQLEEISLKQASLLDLFMTMQISTDEYTTRQFELETAKQYLNHERAAKQNWLDDGVLLAGDSAVLQHYCDDASRRLDDFTLEEKRWLLKALSVRVEFDGQVLRISGGVPEREVVKSSLLPRPR